MADVKLKPEETTQIHHQNSGILGHQQFYAFRFLY